MSSAAKRTRGDEANDPIAELARTMTPQKLGLLSPAERQMVLAYMQQCGIPMSLE